MDPVITIVFAVGLCDGLLVHLIAEDLLPRVPHNFPPHPTRETDGRTRPSDDTALTLAHHDLWWAKGHAWTVANWAVATLVALAVVDRSKWPAGLLAPLSVALTLLAVGGIWYLGRMQADMSASRLKALFHIRRSSDLTASIGLWSGHPNDYNRNSGFVRALMLLVAMANGLALFLLGSGAAVALVTICGQFAFGGVLQSYQVRNQVITILRDADAV